MPYVLEFNPDSYREDESGEAALEQIKNKGYAEKYYVDSREKILLGINFSSELKTIDDWKIEVFE